MKTTIILLFTVLLLTSCNSNYQYVSESNSGYNVIVDAELLNNKNVNKYLYLLKTKEGTHWYLRSDFKHTIGDTIFICSKQ